MVLQATLAVPLVKPVLQAGPQAPSRKISTRPIPSRLGAPSALTNLVTPSSNPTSEFIPQKTIASRSCPRHEACGVLYEHSRISNSPPLHVRSAMATGVPGAPHKSLPP